MRYEFLRNVYASSGLSIRPKTQTSKMDAVKAMIRVLGMNPDQVPMRESLIQPARTYIGTEDRENHQLQVLTETLRELIREEAIEN